MISAAKAGQIVSNVILFYQYLTYYLLLFLHIIIFLQFLFYIRLQIKLLDKIIQKEIKSQPNGLIQKARIRCILYNIMSLIGLYV